MAQEEAREKDLSSASACDSKSQAVYRGDSGENQICQEAEVSSLREHDDLKGMTVRVYLDDPWDLVTAVGSGPLQATVLQVGGDSWLPEAQSLLLRLAGPFEYGGVVCEYVIASSRYRKDDLAGVARGSSVACSFTRISSAQAASDGPFDLGVWRGGLAWLGTLSMD